MALDTRIPMAVPNVLAMQSQVQQNNAQNANALAVGFQSINEGLKEPMRRNALALDNRNSELAQTQAEQQMLGQVLDGVAQNPATWGRARQFLVQNGVFQEGELPEQLTQQAFEELSVIAFTPPEQLTDMGRIAQSLSPEERQRFFRIKAGIEPDANAQLRAQQPGLSFSSTPDGGFTFTQGNTPGGVQPDPGKRSEAFGKKMGEQDAAKVEEKRKFQNGISALERRDALLLETIDSAIAQAEGSSWNTGFVGQQSAQIGGTPAFKLNKTLDTVKANLGFNELNAMRQNSPTGGALGNVTEREIEFLQAVQGSLDIGQGDAQLIGNLRRIREGILANAKERQAAFERDFGSAVSAPQQFDFSTVSDEDLMRALEAAQ